MSRRLAQPTLELVVDNEKAERGGIQDFEDIG
jgi:hypothetical protein